jgi:hypothetical protein
MGREETVPSPFFGTKRKTRANNALSESRIKHLIASERKEGAPWWSVPLYDTPCVRHHRKWESGRKVWYGRSHDALAQEAPGATRNDRRTMAPRVMMWPAILF